MRVWRNDDRGEPAGGRWLTRRVRGIGAARLPAELGYEYAAGWMALALTP
jgi:hypothetical protein